VSIIVIHSADVEASSTSTTVPIYDFIIGVVCGIDVDVVSLYMVYNCVYYCDTLERADVEASSTSTTVPIHIWHMAYDFIIGVVCGIDVDVVRYKYNCVYYCMLYVYIHVTYYILHITYNHSTCTQV
jgi:hypothetical protein